MENDTFNGLNGVTYYREDFGAPRAAERKEKMSQPMRLLTSHETAEWSTPPELMPLVREVMPVIHLDPASNKMAQEWIRAASFWTIEDDKLFPTLKRQWGDAAGINVFLNAPYGKTNGKSNQGIWAEKLIQEYESHRVKEAIMLINNSSGYLWFEELWRKCAVCCVKDRPRFIKPDGTAGGQAKKAAVFCYFGENVEKFAAVFSKIGRIILPENQ